MPDEPVSSKKPFWATPKFWMWLGGFVAAGGLSVIAGVTDYITDLSHLREYMDRQDTIVWQVHHQKTINHQNDSLCNTDGKKRDTRE